MDNIEKKNVDAKWKGPSLRIKHFITMGTDVRPSKPQADRWVSVRKEKKRRGGKGKVIVWQERGQNRSGSIVLNATAVSAQLC